VVVGDDHAVVTDQDARAERILDALARGTTERKILTEKALEERIVEQRRDRALLDGLPGVDVDHGRRRAAHDRREGQRDLLARFGDGGIGRRHCGRQGETGGKQRGHAHSDLFESRKHACQLKDRRPLPQDVAAFSA
jgi:hypothetical protein